MFIFKEFDQKLLDSTRTIWCEQAKEHTGEILISHYERMLNWVEEIVKGKSDNDKYAYGLVHEKSPDCACAVLDISHARPNSNAPWLKVLSICMEPRLDVLVSGGKDGEAAKVVAASIVEALGLTFETHPSNQLKVYATTPLTVDFLGGIASISFEDGMGLNVSTHGGWLVIDKE